VIVVVGGSSRKAGKTAVVCEIIAATREAQWTAVKVTPHTHDPSSFGDTERYASSGAARSLLVREFSSSAVSGNIIVESNSVLDVITPDLFVFVAGEGDWKASAERHAAKADYIVHGHATTELLDQIKVRLVRATK
jgi:molybdopterin-guanine dinucleotide biosynthesis protein